VTILFGGDSATPKPAQYQGKKVWGVYVAGDTFRVWTKAEVEELSQHGIEGVMPIVVPPQNQDWWLDNGGYATLEQLVREAKAWGVPEESPLCLDIEEHQFEAMGPHVVKMVQMWAQASRAHKYRTWTYGSLTCLRNDLYGFKWVAAWPDPTPTNPEIPAGFNAWQYATRPAEGIDLDIFEAGRDYMTPDRKVVVLEAPSVKSHSESSSNVATADSTASSVSGPAGARADTPQTPAGNIETESNETVSEVPDSPGVVGLLSPSGYDSTQSSVSKGGAMSWLTGVGHLVIGAISIAAVTTLCALGDVTGTTAIDTIIALVGVSLGIGVAANSTTS
jgi:hypothetical protein